MGAEKSDGWKVARKVATQAWRRLARRPAGNRPVRILLYTDSRGTNLPGHEDYAHYGVRLAERFDVHAVHCPEKWTTVPDFLKYLSTHPHDQYDAIILHAGAVDAAPRHQKSLLESIYVSKKDILDEIFGERHILEYLHTDFGYEFEGDRASNLYSLEMAEKYLLPRLMKIPNLIWVSSNRIVKGWRGNYWRDRPANVEIIEAYSDLFASKLKHVVNLMAWTLDEVKHYTFDNIHPTQAGSEYIHTELIKLLPEVIGNRRS